MIRLALVADDDPSTGRLLATLSNNERFQATTVSDGGEAFARFKLMPIFEVAVCDITLPNVDCIELLQHPKPEKRLSHIPVVVFSNAQDLKGMAQSFAAGAVAFLSKPFLENQITACITHCSSQKCLEEFQRNIDCVSDSGSR